MSGKAVLRWVMRVALLVLVLIALAGTIIPELVPAKGPEWRGVVVGVSTEQDVVATLGNPTAIRRGLFGTTLIYEEPRVVRREQLVVLRFGVVQEIREDTLAYRDEPTLLWLLEKYGSPDLVEWSTDNPGSRSLVFAGQGVIADVHAAPLAEATATRIIYTKPLLPVLAQIRYPWMFLPVDLFWDIDVVGPKDPWFGTSDQCRWVCD